MTIDPETIPCAYCGSNGKGDEFIFTHGSFDVTLGVKCLKCGTETSPSDWITGGINALVGKLLRFGIEIWESSEGWTWDSTDEEGKAWQTFEYCVLDAWEKMSMNKT